MMFDQYENGPYFCFRNRQEPRMFPKLGHLQSASTIACLTYKLVVKVKVKAPRISLSWLVLKTEDFYCIVLLFYVHGKHLRSCQDGQLTKPHFSWAGLDLLSS